MIRGFTEGGNGDRLYMDSLFPQEKLKSLSIIHDCRFAGSIPADAFAEGIEVRVLSTVDSESVSRLKKVRSLHGKTDCRSASRWRVVQYLTRFQISGRTKNVIFGINRSSHHLPDKNIQATKVSGPLKLAMLMKERWSSLTQTEKANPTRLE